MSVQIGRSGPGEGTSDAAAWHGHASDRKLGVILCVAVARVVRVGEEKGGSTHRQPPNVEGPPNENARATPAAALWPSLPHNTP